MTASTKKAIVFILLAFALILAGGQAALAAAPETSPAPAAVQGKVPETIQDSAPAPPPETEPVPPGANGIRSARNSRLQYVFTRAENLTEAAGEGIGLTLYHALRLPAGASAALETLSGGNGFGRLFTLAAGCLMVILAGGLAEYLFRRTFFSSLPTFGTERFSPLAASLLTGLTRFLYDLTAILCYVLVTFLAVVIFFTKGETGHMVASTFLIASYSVQLTRLLSSAILSPHNAMLRLLPFCDTSAPVIAWWIILISATVNGITATSHVLSEGGLGHSHFLMIYGLSGLSAILMLVILVLWYRSFKATHIQQLQQEGAACQPPEDCEQQSDLGYALTIAYIVTLGIFWEIGLFKGGADMTGKLKISLISLPVFIALDYWGQRLIDKLAEKMDTFYGTAAPETEDAGSTAMEDASAEAADEGADDEKAETGGTIGIWQQTCYLPLMKRTLRIFMAGALIFWVMKLWGLDLVRLRGFSIAVGGLFLTLLTWEFTKATINNRLQEEMPEEDEEMDEGGSGGSRTGTILILMKKGIAVILAGIAVLLTLSALGIDIAPLVAGAGILGLAVGFGAQTLVKDIISGIFFLIDDAFRLGDYVDTGKAKGTVEQISLRSLRLRHHRGMILTIPFGDLGAVTNFSRDYIIMKLEFRVRYDTNIEKVRKIIKKMGKKIAANPEHGKSLLSPIKSQGVKALDDSAMVMRIKFKCIPGEQFVIRREILRRVQEEFRKNDIAFAHRNVTVYLPPEEQQAQGIPEEGKENETKGGTDGEPSPNERLRQLAAGAGAAALEQAEKERKKAANTGEQRTYR